VSDTEGGSGGSKETIGRLLKETRSERGLTVEEVSAASKVPAYLIRLMEDEQFHLLPDPSYVLRFLTDYAGHLGLDARLVEAQFRRQMRPAGEGLPLQTLAAKRARTGPRRLALALLALAAGIPLVFLVLSLLAGRPGERPPAVPVQGAAPPDVSPSVAPSEQLAQGAPYTLRAETKQTTSLLISVDGAPPHEVTLQPGKFVQWSAVKGFVVTIADAEGVSLLLNGKRVVLPHDQHRPIQNLSLPGDGNPHR
jgi:cytoskeletal protein RodZ